MARPLETSMRTNDEARLRRLLRAGVTCRECERNGPEWPRRQAATVAASGALVCWEHLSSVNAMHEARMTRQRQLRAEAKRRPLASACRFHKLPLRWSLAGTPFCPECRRQAAIANPALSRQLAAQLGKLPETRRENQTA